MRIRLFIASLQIAFVVVSCSSGVGSVYEVQPGVTVYEPAGYDASQHIPSPIFLKELRRCGGEVSGSDAGLCPKFYRAWGKSVVSIDAGDADLYGGGEVSGNLRRNGDSQTIWNTDNPTGLLDNGKRMYQSHPWLLGVRKDGSAFGIIADNTWKTFLSMKGRVQFRSEGPAFRVVIIEKESPQLLKSLAISGILATMIAMISERIGSAILNAFLPYQDPRYDIILYFVIVAVSEEAAKYALMKRKTWNSVEFNCQYDGVVYAVFTSLGFALWENISYVLNYGFSTAIVRAITAIPGHACFGVFMGIFYGIAKKYERYGNKSGSKTCRMFALIIPVLLHGAYDFIASLQDVSSGLYFTVFVLIMFFISFVAFVKSFKIIIFS